MPPHPHPPPSPTTTTALHRTNLSSNRYSNILPYDHALLPGPYLNATPLPPFPLLLPPSPAYIATQAPLPHTLSTFFHHLHRTRPHLLVNLTAESEAGTLKAHRYWPAVHAGWSLHVLEEQRLPHGIVQRRLGVEPPSGEGKVWRFTQLHVTRWPDHGVLEPDELESLLDRIEEVQSQPGPLPSPQQQLEGEVEVTGETAGPPVWIHCSAGVGRTGTVVACLTARELARRGLLPPKAEAERVAGELVQWMRAYRAGMVQTPGQFEAVVQVVRALAS